MRSRGLSSAVIPDATQHKVLLRWSGICFDGLEFADSDPVLAVQHFVLHSTRDDDYGKSANPHNPHTNRFPNFTTLRG